MNDLVGRDGLLRLLRAVRPDDREFVSLRGGAEAEGEHEFRLAQVASAAHEVLALDEVADFDFNASADCGAVGATAVAFEADAEPVVLVAAVVAEQAWRAAVGGEQHIEVAVAVDVGVGGAPADDRLRQIAQPVLLHPAKREWAPRPQFQKSWAGWR